MGYAWYQWTAVFVIYAVIGWCTEVIYAAVEHGKFVNRGFLNGPVCPIYGFGGTIVIACLYGMRDNMWLVFIGAFFLSSILEYITGFLLEKIFHEHWWDYSDKPFNIKGYVCLEFSIFWGIACMLVVDIVHPPIDKLVRWIPERIGIILICLAAAGFVADISVTVATIVEWKKEMRLMNEIVSILRAFSDGVGDDISNAVLKAMDKGAAWKDVFEADEKHAEIKEEMERKKAEAEALREKYMHMLKKKRKRHARLEKAFPKLNSQKPLGVLKKWKEEKNSNKSIEEK